jgi:hypothetical protein
MAVDLAVGPGDAEALAASVRAVEPDVVAVLGAPRFLRWRSKRAALARQCGLVVATTDRPGGTFLMASLRAAVVAESVALLPLSPGGRRHSVVSALFDTSGTRWRVAALQLGRDAGERASHAAPVTATLFAPDAEGLLVLAADLAEPPDGPLQADLRDRLTVAAESGTSVVLVDRSLRVIASEGGGFLAMTVSQ